MASNYYLGQILPAGFNFAPEGTQLCNGQTLSISQYSALYALLGTTYGGNGTTTFQLPNLQSRVPIHQGTGNELSTYVIGQSGGQENVLLSSNNMPVHNHPLNAVAGAATTATPSVSVALAEPVVAISHPVQDFPGVSAEVYGTGTPATALNVNSIGTAGGSVPHENIQPYLVISFVIVITGGIYPSRN